MDMYLRDLFLPFLFLVVDRTLTDMICIHKDVKWSNETTAVIGFSGEIPLKIHDIMNNGVKKRQGCKYSLKCFHKHIKTPKHREAGTRWKCILRWHFEQTGEIKRRVSNLHATQSLLEMQLQVHSELQRRKT